MVYDIFLIKFNKHVEYKSDIIHHIKDILSFHLMEFLFTLSLKWEVRHEFRQLIEMSLNTCGLFFKGNYNNNILIWFI